MEYSRLRPDLKPTIPSESQPPYRQQMRMIGRIPSPDLLPGLAGSYAARLKQKCDSLFQKGSTYQGCDMYLVFG
jgi:hypothetical protein